MISKQSVINGILYCGITKEEYNALEPRINQKNKKMLFVASLVGTVILLVLFICSFFLDSIKNNTVLYAVFTGLSLFVFCLNLIKSANRYFVMIMCYFFLGVVLAFGIVLGTFYMKTGNATTFCVLLLALPLLFVGKPYRMTTAIILSTIAFCICAAIAKKDSPKLVSLDIIKTLYLSLSYPWWLIFTTLKPK